MINILSPQFLENMPQPLVDLYSELETFVLTDIARRLKTAGTTTSTAEWQKQQAQLFNINNINQKVAQILKKSNSEIEKMFEEAALTTILSENKTFKQAGYKTIELEESNALQDYLKTAIKQTKGDVENITRTMGFAENKGGKIVYNSVAKFYQQELNVAHIKISSGVQDYNTAIKQAANKISESGVRTIDYDKKYSINVDSAARRAVVTSVHQFNQETINHISKEIVNDEDKLYYEVTAHAGARTGIGINNHAGWQGKVYKWIGSDKEYENLKEVTGLGDILGLMGVNCKHSYFAYIPGVSVRAYTDEELKNIDPPPFTYNDKEYTHYEATQYQRQLENEIRKLKRENLIYKETGLDNELRTNNAKIKALTKEYKDFSSVAEIRPKTNRTQI